MAFTIPNHADANSPFQAEPDSVDFDILAAGYSGSGVVSGCAVTAQSTPNLTVAVAAGVVIVAGVRASVTGANATIGTADGTNPRFDMITVNNSGTIATTAGTAASVPELPSIPSNSVVIALIFVPANDTTIATAQITDKRVFVSSGAAGGVLDDIILGVGSDSDIAILNRSSTLSADAEVTNVIEGTSDHLGVAANSLIVSNITNCGDIMFAVSDGGHSKGLLKLDGANGRVVIHGGDLLMSGAQKIYFYDVGGEYMSSDGSTLTITGATALTPTVGSTAWAAANHAHAASNSGGTLTTLGTISTGVWNGTALTTTYIGADAITSAKVADCAIDSEHYTDGSIDTAHIADNQVTVAKLADISRGSIVYGNASAATAELTKGSANTVLTSDGTDISWQAASSGATTVTVTDNESTDENNVIVFVAGADADGGNVALESDGDLHYNPSTGRLTATQLAGTLQTAAQTAITSVGTLGALTVDDVAINGKVVTMTGSACDTIVMTAAAHGAFSLVTTDTAAAAANIVITADGTVDINSAGVLTLDSGAAINIEPASGSAILLDGTISVDAGVVTGATSITSTVIELGHASDTTIARSGSGAITVEGNQVYLAGGTDVALADGGTGASLSDPGADRIMFWDDGASAVAFLSAGSGLTICGTTMTASGGPCQATKCSLESRTNQDTYAPPDLMQHHPGVAKAYTRFSANAGVERESYNICDICDNATGDWKVQFVTNFAAADNYTGVAMTKTGDSTTTGAIIVIGLNDAWTAGEARLSGKDEDGCSADPSGGGTPGVMAVFYGLQA